MRPRLSLLVHRQDCCFTNGVRCVGVGPATSTRDLAFRGSPNPPWNRSRERPVEGGMDLPDALDFVRTTRQSVLTTIRGNGRPQLSNVLHHVFDDGIVRISITADRAKY